MTSTAFNVDVREVTEYLAHLGAASRAIVDAELRTAVGLALDDQQQAVTKRVKHRSGRYAQSFHKTISGSGTGIVGTLSNTATSDGGFVYAVTLEFGRGPVTVKNGRALGPMNINGLTLFRHSVKAAPAQHPMEYGLADAGPQIDARFAVAETRIAAKIEALR